MAEQAARLKKIFKITHLYLIHCYIHSRLTCFGASVLIIRFNVFRVSQHGNMLKYGYRVVSDKINVLALSPSSPVQQIVV